MNVPVARTTVSLAEYDEMKLAYSYVRFSTSQQKLGASGSRQIEAAVEWCKNNGYTLSNDHFRDEGKSAHKGKHLQGEGDLKRFLSLVESGRIPSGSVLVLESYDRLSRLPMSKSVSLFLDIINAGIGMVFTMTYDKRLITANTIDTEPHILYAILGEAQRSYSESAWKSKRVKDAYDRRKLKAKETNFKSLAWCPPWCDFDEEHGYTENKERADVVRRIFTEYLKGFGTFKIARLLNVENLPRLGHRSFTEYQNTAKMWYRKTVKDFLKDKRVYGYCEFLDREGYYPKIITKDKFNEVQNRLALRANEKPTGGPIESVGNLFTGLVRCAHCNNVMTKGATRKKYKTKITRYEYLVCEGARSGKGCSYKSVPYGEFETRVLDALRIDTFHNLISNTNPTKGIEDRLAALEGEKVTNEKQIQKLTDSFLLDENPSVTLTKKLKEFEARQIEVAKEIQLTTANLRSAQLVPGNVVGIFEKIDELKKTKEGRLKIREALRSILDEITLDSATNTTTFHFKPNFVGNVNAFVAEETVDENGATFVKFVGSATVRIAGEKIDKVSMD